ncbi:hypothetical protein CVT26_001127 [Gymnopilus dilepis]|uniref:DUF6534 domain-containing protein n=1 Tax=Gymnopilus dilepis TaxID=231916 RepID=A0A409WW61_9AGAR|nr:hypothetical protein CVT26_001127 [Gymnopilus dilepis]
MGSTSFLLNSTLGAVLAGVLVSATLFGVTVVQAYVYYTRFPDDRLALKYLVTLLCICEFGHCVCISHAIYEALIQRYGTLSAITFIPLSWSLAVGLSGVIEPAVQVFAHKFFSCLVLNRQAFFAYRLFVVTRLFTLSVIFWTLSILRCALTFTAMAESIKSPSSPLLMENFKWLIQTLLVAGTVNDLALAVTFVCHLRNVRLRIVRTDPRPPLLNRIMAWTIQSGILAAVIDLAMLIAFFVRSDTYIWQFFFSFSARIYSISFLASLNGRTIPRQNGLELHVRGEIHLGNADTTHSVPLGIISLAKPEKGTQDWRCHLEEGTTVEKENID